MTQIPNTIFPLLVAVTIVQRLHELLRSRNNQHEMAERGFERVDSSLSYACMVGVHTTWFIAMLCEHYLRSSSIPAVISWVALIVFVAAQLLRVWALRVLGSQWNVQVMAPASDGDNVRLVTVGPYRYVRHPNYLAVILEFAALPLVGSATITAVVWSCLNGLVLYFRIRREEQYLKRRPGFEGCLSKVPCLVPRLWVL